jgi:hypothetical protein
MNRALSAYVLLCLGLSATARADELAEAQAPLADVPSEAGPHVAKIQALGDNEWLNLDTPAADPKWGGARGRSWSSNMPAAPKLRGAFVFAEGVHAYVKPDGHYMNDVWFYDINAHRWVCLYPGIEVKSIAQRIQDGQLTVDENGLLVDQSGEPLPPLLIHAYGNLGYEPERKKFTFFGSQFGNYFTTGERGVFHEANKLFQEQRERQSQAQGKKLPDLSPFFYDVASGKFECFPVEHAPPGGGGFGRNMLVYVPTKKQFLFGGTDGVWFLDMEKRAWIDADPEGTAPTGIDHCAAYDSKRDRIYYQHRDDKTASDNFFIYDVKRNTWSQPHPKGPGPFYSSAYESIFNSDTANDRLVVIRHKTTEDEPGHRRGVSVYDPNTNTWADPLPLPTDVVQGLKNGPFGFYDPQLNAYFCYFASDSNDDGSMWVYRYRNAR